MIFGGQLYSFMGDSNWQVLMYTAIIPPAVGAVMIFLFVPNDYQNTRQLNEVSKQQNEKISYLNMYKGKYLWIGLGVILLSGANFTAYSAFSNNATTYLAELLGLSAAVAGGIYSLQGIGQLIGYNIWGFISDRFGRKKPLIGMALSAVFVFLFMRLGAGNITQLKLVSVFLGFAVGFSGAWGAYYTELFPQKFSACPPESHLTGEESYPPLPFLQLQAWAPRLRGCRGSSWYPWQYLWQARSYGCSCRKLIRKTKKQQIMNMHEQEVVRWDNIRKQKR